MLPVSSITRAVAPLSVEAPQNPATDAAVNVLQEQQALQQGKQPPGCSGVQSDLKQLDKSEINDAVTKVLQGYDWTLVPIASK